MNIFFDLDGTLIDISGKYYRVYADLVGTYNGDSLSRSAFWRHKRNKIPACELLTKSALPSVNADQFSDKFANSLESKKYLTYDRLFPFAHRCLTSLIKHGHTLHLVSARHNKKDTLEEITGMGLTKYFTSIYVGHMHVNGRVAKRKAIEPVLTGRSGPFLIIGDTQDEIEAARDLNGISVAVLSGVRNRTLLASYRPDYIVRDIRNIPASCLDNVKKQ
jgi:phosphoglycolate phosphatase